jgi:hypothetical protein
MPDERRRFDRRRPSDADITADHNRLVEARHIAETAPPIPDVDPVGGDDAASLPEAVETHTTEPTSGDRPGSDARERALAALRRAISGAGRGRHRMRQAVTVPQVAAEPDDHIAETHDDERAPVVRDVTHVQISEEFRGLPELSGHADPHWSERDNRGHRYADPNRTDQE